MSWERGQVATEYLVVTAFILVVVTVIFSFAFVNYDQSIKVAKASDALARMAGAADRVYSLGEGNVQFVGVAFPSGMTAIEVKHVCCTDPPDCTTKQAVASEDDCSGLGGEVEFSLIAMTVNLVGGSTEIRRNSKAKLVLTDFSAGELAGGPAYSVRVSWTDTGKIELRRV